MRHSFEARSNHSFPTRFHTDTAAPALQPRHSVVPLSSVSVQEVLAQPVDRTLWLSKLIPEAKFFGCDDVAWTTLARSASDCEEGELVAFRTGESDPSEFIATAMARGAGGILTEQLLPCPIPQCIVGDVDRALAGIAAVECDRPDRKLLTVGILGASGKTSTCLLAATVTGRMGIRTAYQCDLGCSDGVVSESADRHVPAGAELIRWLADAGDCLSRAALIEIDEQAARAGHYDSIEFDVLIVTGRSELTSDFGPNGLQCMLERLTEGGVVITPSADAKATAMVGQFGGHHVTYGTSGEDDFAATIIEQADGMMTLMLNSGDTNVMMETALCGSGMASNIAAAFAFASLLGHSVSDIAQHLSSLRTIPGRRQRLVEFGCATVVLEKGGAVDRVIDSLKTARKVGNGGKVWCVFAIGEEDEDTLAGYGHAIERFAHHCVVTSREDHRRSFLKASHQLLDGVKECAAMRLVADPKKAVQWALQTSGVRDTVVFIGNPSGLSAAEERREWEALAGYIESIREPQEMPVVSGQIGQPIKLKLFRPE